MMGSNKAAASDSYAFDLAGDDDEEEQEMASPAPAPKAKVSSLAVYGGCEGWRGWQHWMIISRGA